MANDRWCDSRPNGRLAGFLYGGYPLFLYGNGETAVPSGVFNDLTGRRFGRLVVIGRSNIRAASHSAWECRCDCGSLTFTDGGKLTNGQKMSCGCLRAEARQARLSSRVAQHQRQQIEAAAAEQGLPLGLCCITGCGRIERSVGFCAHHYDIWNRFGHPLAGTLLSRRSMVATGRSKEIKAYSAMRTRCYNPKARSYSGYGGRGITVCPRWLDSFENFLADMGSAPAGTSLERGDVNGNYEPSNCRWATSSEQMRNTRATRLTADLVVAMRMLQREEGMSVAQIARDLGVSYGAVYAAVNGISWKDVEVAGRG